MADEMVLKVDTTRELGSGASRRLRREGLVPGVVYGLDADPVAVAVPYADLRASLTTDAGLNALINLDFDGDKQLSIVKDLQHHPVRNEVVHVDFIRIDPNAEIEVDVPIVLVGEAKAVSDNDGMVDQTMFTLTVYSSPQSIPNEVEADVTELEINDAIRVGDIVLPAGVRTEVEADEAVAVGTVTRSTIEAMAAAEAGEGEEGDEGAGDAGGDDAGDDAGGDDAGDD